MASSRYARNDNRPGYIEPDVTPTTESGRDDDGAWALSDDPVWGPLYRDLIHDRYAQFHRVIAKHRPAIEQEAASKAVAEVLDRLDSELGELPLWSPHPDVRANVMGDSKVDGRPYLIEPDRVRALIASERKP